MDRLGDADVTHVTTLAKQYCTSLEAASNRYCELTDDICAFVFAKDGVIRYVRSVGNFPRLAVTAGDRLPDGCASLRAPAFPLRVATPWAELDGSIWLQTEWGRKSPALLEQTLRQADGFQISLLFIRFEETENEEEEAEITKSWEVRFRRQ